jgi:hypothetical protein
MSIASKGTPEWDTEVKFYLSASPKALDKRAIQLGILPTSYRRIMQKRGIQRNKGEDISIIPEQTQEKIIEHIPYPEFDLVPFPRPKTERDEEDMVVVISDWHLCKVTSDYNIDIAKNRVEYLTKAIMKVENLHRPIRKLWLFDAGDTIQGENTHQGSKVGEVSHSAEEQIYDFAIPMLSKMMISLNQSIPKIEYLTVRSNHGIYSPEANPKTNWQTTMARALKSSLVNQPNITVDVPNDWYQLVNIRGFRFFLIHGDQFYSTHGTPLVSIKTKMGQYQAKYHFHFAYMGHFHSKSSNSVNDISDVTVCPPLVTGDSWAMEKVGSGSVPKQICFGVHNTFARTFQYDLFADKKYLPVPINEPEGIVRIGENPDMLMGDKHATNNVEK